MVARPPPPGQHCQRREDRDRKPRQRPHQPHGVGDQFPEGAEEHRVIGGAQAREIACTQSPSKSQHVCTHVLQSGSVETFGGIAAVVIRRGAIHECEVESDKAGFMQRCEIAVLVSRLIQRRQRRVAYRVRGRSRVLLDQLRIPRGRLKQHRRTHIAGGLPIQHHPTLVVPRTFGDEEGSA
jgi:hypothetical protein